MIEAVDWCLAKEERSQDSASFSGALAHFPSPAQASQFCIQEKAVQKEYRRHIAKLKHMSAPTPRANQKKSRSGKKDSKHVSGIGGIVEGNDNGGTGMMFGMTVPGSNESYERLFNPQWGTVRSKQGICAALAYLVVQFLELKQSSKGVLQDGSRVSLRLAVSSLARHHAFDDLGDAKGEAGEVALQLRPEEEESRWTKPGEEEESEEMKEECNMKILKMRDERMLEMVRVGHDQEFRAAALALLCLLDAALAWRPADPMGWMGQAEDAEGAVLAREREMCSFPYFAGKLRRSLKKASAGCQIAWQRFEVHLDAVRARTLPDPWPWIWVLNEEASMLVRNRTKVPLRVELHRPKPRPPSVWADLPLLKPLVRWMSAEKAILVAEVKPGIEWALRPRAKEGREFRVRLMTKAGVMVCARGLRRGQSLDFEVPVPPAPAQLRAVALNHSTAPPATVKGRIKATNDAFKALGGFPSWDKVRTARPAAVQKVIRCGGLAPKKTKWIQNILKTLHKERGQTSMEFLRKLDKDSVHQELERFQGVGKKTSAIINMFDCNNPDMAVDTHVFRYALQLGWAPSEEQRVRHNKGSGTAWPTITRDTVYAHLDATFPDTQLEWACPKCAEANPT
eukprot:Skav233453  [mRNA]  locus=scaffold1486:443846:457009:- [translate_table: standard]